MYVEKRLARQDTDYAINPGNNNETSIKISDDICKIFIDNQNLEDKTKISVNFFIYKSDFVKSACGILSSLPLLDKHGHTIGFRMQLYNDLFSQIESFFGDEEKVSYNAELLYNKSRNSCLQGFNKILNIRAFTVESWSTIRFQKKNDGVHMHLIFSKKVDKINEKPKQEIITLDYPLQQIFYGAPGTGKSHEIKIKTAGEAVIRTTFHPDSDYSTFVGAYKPVMDDVDIQVVPLVVNNGISLEQNKGTYKERRISYKFVMQAFLKAYLGAWKKYVDCNANFGLVANNLKVSLSFAIPNIGKYTVISVDSNGLKLSKEFSISKNKVLYVWDRLWKNDVFEIPIGPQPGASLEQAIGKWIYDVIDNCTSSCFDAGWNKLVEQIRENGSVEVQKQQVYELTLHESEELLFVKVKEAGKNRNTLKTVFEDSSETKPQLDSAIVEILKQFSNSFDEAWEKLKMAVNEGNGLEKAKDNKVYIKPQFLIIEEINRGNCAQIFGDLFQLLDRSSNGFSEYPIEADMDLQKEIERSFRESKAFKLINDINIEGAVEGYTSNYGATLSEDVKNGRVLLLPPNLYIWATMNTSDQSLFPIDSAFKRRWEWKYIKIRKGKDENGYELDWKIDVKMDDEGNLLPWWDFINKINVIIASMTSSADKQLGFFFCRAKDGVISEDIFVSKVIFYLWNDVFKDYGFEDTSLFRFTTKDESGTERERDLTFPDFYDEDGEKVNTERLTDFVKKVMNWKKKEEDD